VGPTGRRCRPPSRWGRTPPPRTQEGMGGREWGWGAGGSLTTLTHSPGWTGPSPPSSPPPSHMISPPSPPPPKVWSHTRLLVCRLPVARRRVGGSGPQGEEGTGHAWRSPTRPSGEQSNTRRGICTPGSPIHASQTPKKNPQQLSTKLHRQSSFFQISRIVKGTAGH